MNNRTPRSSAAEETSEEVDVLELPVNPDEGTLCISDEEERVVNVPS